MKAPARNCSLVIAALLVFSSLGCTTLPVNLLARGGRDEASQPLAGPAVTMSIRPDGRKAESAVIPLKPGMTVQTVLEHKRLTHRFRNMKINVMRVTPESNGVRAPLKAEYDPAKNRVGILHDFALYPGDHVMVEEDNTTNLDQIVERFGGMVGMRR